MTTINLELELYGTNVSCPACCAILSHGHGSATMVQRRVADLISRNIPPSDAEAHDLQHTDLDPVPYLAQIEQKIAELTNEIARLSTARAHLERHPHHVKGILHPIRSLPEDVLREIFLRSTLDSDEELVGKNHDSLHSRRPQWVLSQVCRRWRDITLAFPRLWSSLYLTLDQFYFDPSPTSRWILRLTIYLDRSANRRMTVYISRSVHSRFQSSDFVHLGPLLRQTTSRWVDCRLETTFEFLHVIFSNCDFGSLARLRLEGTYQERYTPKRLLDVFKNVPLLRSLDYRSSYYEDYPVLLPWEQLTTVKVAAIALSDPFVLGPLKRLMNVQHLTLHLSDLDLERDTLRFLSVHLPSVTSLHLSGLVEEDAQQIGQLISSLEMPSITELELAFEVGFGSNSGSDEDEVEAALTITFPPFHSSVHLGQLTALSISCSLEDDTDGVDKLVAFLLLVPNLHRFRLCDSLISPAVVDAMTLRDGYSNLLPCLRILDFSGSDLDEDVGVSQYLSMLESRCPSRGTETRSRTTLTQLFLSPSTTRTIGVLCFDGEIRGRWDEISTSISIR